MPTLAAGLGEQVRTSERGALDDLDDRAIDALRPRAGENAFISRLRDGRSVSLAADRLEPLLAEAGSRLAQDVDAVLLLCSGDYPDHEWGVPVVYPDRVIGGVLGALTSQGTSIGVVSPLPQQTAAVCRKWGHLSRPLLAATASPYTDNGLGEAARSLARGGADLLLLDCLGFGRQHRELVRATTGRPVVLPSSLIAHTVREVLA
jgi:protein AroM